jgi:hypothetical protein
VPRSARKPPARARGKGKSGSRLQTVGLLLTLLVVAALIGSVAWGALEYFKRGRGTSPEEPSRPGASAPATPPAGRVRVEVLNASGRPGLAAEVRRVLRDGGFDVVLIGNAPGFAPDTSLVLDRAGRMDAARQVADALGIRRVYARPDPNLYLDATVVLGRDWRPASADPPAAP